VETVYRRYGEEHAVDESILHATAIGRPFGLDGRGRHIQVRVLHLFEFGEELITRESAWLDIAGLQQQLAR
jgi:predicted ester cyclase